MRIGTSSPAVAGILTACALAGCVHAGHEAVRGKLIEPESLGLSATPSPAIPDGWWAVFGDQQLDRLIEMALAGNPTLDQAMARVRRSEAESQAAGAALRPAVAVDADEVWQRFSGNFYIPPPFAGHRFWVGTTGANLSWAMDFWGRQAAVLQQARAGEYAARLDAISARLAVGGAVAQTYLDLYRSYELSDVAARIVEQRERLLKLTGDRVNAGLENTIALKTAEAGVADARGAFEQVSRQRELAVHRLAALSARGADSYATIGRPQLTLDSALPVPDSLPLDLLQRRPDVLAARWRVDAADAGRAAARAAFYPDVSLRAFVGVQAVGLDSLFRADSVIYGAGPALHLPIFDAQRLHSAYRSSTAQLDLAIASYNEVVLNAVRETADQLSLIDSLARQREQVTAGRAAARATYELAQQRYGAGLVSQFVVLEAESAVLAAERDWVVLDADRAMARVTLLLTLGGSFNDRTQ